MLGDTPRVEEYRFFPKYNRHNKEIVEEILYTTILKALAISSLNIDFPKSARLKK